MANLTENQQTILAEMLRQRFDEAKDALTTDDQQEVIILAYQLGRTFSARKLQQTAREMNEDFEFENPSHAGQYLNDDLAA